MKKTLLKRALLALTLGLALASQTPAAGRGKASTASVIRAPGTTVATQAKPTEQADEGDFVKMTEEEFRKHEKNLAFLKNKIKQEAFPSMTHLLVGGLSFVGGLATWFVFGPKVMSMFKPKPKINPEALEISEKSTE